MPSTFSPSLRLELIGNGEQAANWGNTTNTNLGTLLEQAITGVGNIVMAGTSVTLVSGSGIADEARNAVLVLGGTLSASCNLIVPTANKFYAVRNATIGSQNVVVKTSAGTGVGLANGYTQLMYCDGTNVVPATLPFNSTTGNVIVSGDISVVGAVTVGGATTMNGDAIISKTTPTLTLDKAASGQNNIISGQTNNSYRWIILPGNAEAETGSNAGSNFHIQNYNDSGVNIETPFVINRSTGATTVKQLTASGNISAGSGGAGEKQFLLYNNNRQVYFYLAADGNNSGLYDLNASRTRWNTDNSGNMSVWNNLTMGGGVTSSGDITTLSSLRSKLFDGATGQVLLGNGGYRLYQNGLGAFDVNGNFTASSFISSGADVNVPSASSDGVTYYSSGFAASPANYQTYYRAYHEIGVQAGAQIVVGGNQPSPYVYTFRNDGTAFAANWQSLSDSRVKSDQSIISNSLDKLSQIKGITYKRNDMKNMNGSDIVQAGVLAQDVAEVLPECIEVSSTPPKNDPDGPGLMSINYNGVIALLVNAVNELSAKVDALEKKVAG